MAVPFSNTRLRVPKGFQNVLEGLAREVLRCQPENIYSFSADYFEELLRRRQETGYDDITLLGARLEDRFYNNHSFKNPNVNTNNDEQQSAAVKIQSEYRRFAAKKEVDLKKEEKAAIVIQASVRGHLERQTHRSNSNAEVKEDEEYQENLEEKAEDHHMTEEQHTTVEDVQNNSNAYDESCMATEDATFENSQVLHDGHHQNTEVDEKHEASDDVEHRQNTEDVEYHNKTEDEDHLQNTEDENFEESQIVNEEHQPADEDNLEIQESLEKEDVVNTPDVIEKNEEIDEAQEAPVEEIVNEEHEDKSQNIDSEVQQELQESVEITNVEESLVLEKDNQDVIEEMFGGESNDIVNEEMDVSVLKEESVEDIVVNEEIVKEDIVEEELVENIVVNDEMVNDDFGNEELADAGVVKEEIDEINTEVVVENEEAYDETDAVKPSTPVISEEVDNVEKSETKEDVENESELPTDNLNVEETNEETLFEVAETERTIDVSNDLEDTTINNQEYVQEIENPDNEDHIQESVLTDDAENADTNRTEPEE